MLGDLLRLMPTGSGFAWPLAFQLAASAAAGDGADPYPDPRERIRLEELSTIAELHVADVTGMQLSPAGVSPRLVPTSRAEWARRTLETWRPVLDRLSADVPTAPEPPPSDGDELSGVISRWVAAAMPMMMAMQVGSAAGHLAERALGQYDVPLAPAARGEILVVSSNVAATSADWSLPSDDLSLWLSAHELAHHAVLSRRHVAGRLADLVVEHARSVRPDPTALQSLVSGGMPDLDAVTGLFENTGALRAEGDLPEVQRVRAELDALVATVSGYAEWVTATVADRLIGAHAPIGEAMRRRRLGRGAGEKAAEELFGLRLDQDNVDRGGRFVAGVLERSGEHELARLFVDDDSLPTPAEVDAPGLWLARLEVSG